MIAIRPDKKRLLSLLIFSLLFGFMFIGLGIVLVLLELTFLKVCAAALLCVFGLLLLANGIDLIYLLASGSPCLEANTETVSVRSFFGRKLIARWSNLASISVLNEEDLGRADPLEVDPAARFTKFICFRKTSETNLKAKPILNISEDRLGEPLEIVVQKLLTLSPVRELADETFLASATKIPPASGARFRKILQTVAFCGIIVLIYFAIQPNFKHSERSAIQEGFDARVRKVRVGCSRERESAECEVVLYSAQDDKIGRTRLSNVERLTAVTQGGTAFFLESTDGKRVLIATADLNRVYKGWDSENYGSLAGVNQLKKFFEAQQGAIVSVTLPTTDSP